METVRLTTMINAPVERCFRLAISVDVQLRAARKPARVVRGLVSGLLSAGNEVSYRGLQAGRRYTVLVDEWRPFTYFSDVRLDGPFATFEHKHHFTTMDDGTWMREEICFALRFPLLRKTRERMVRKRLAKFLAARGAMIKQAAESDGWREFLEGQPAIDLNPRMR